MSEDIPFHWQEGYRGRSRILRELDRYVEMPAEDFLVAPQRELENETKELLEKLEVLPDDFLLKDNSDGSLTLCVEGVDVATYVNEDLEYCIYDLYVMEKIVNVLREANIQENTRI